MARFLTFLASLAALLLPGVAYAACPPIPFLFAQGAPFNAPQVNTDFGHLRDCINAVVLGTGDVIGPATSAAGAIAVFNATTGKLLREGAPATVTGNQTSASTGDGFQVQFKNQASTDANAFYIWTCTVYICNNPSALGNFDTSRIITVVPEGSGPEIVASQGIYFINKMGRPGWPSVSPFPTYVGQNIIGICEADGAGCWAGNAIITDNRGQTVPTPKPGMFLVGWEADFHVNSVNTRIAGFITGGTSTVQPAASNGYSCVHLDGPGGTTIKWGTCFSSQHGATTSFADVGTAANDGANTNSQHLNMFYRDAGNVLQNISYAATPGGIIFSTTGLPISASLVIPSGAVFATGDLGGLRINNLAAVGGNGTIVGFGLDAGWTEVNVGNSTAGLVLHGSYVSIPGSKPLVMGGTLNLFPSPTPATPSIGWIIYNDSGDLNKLKAKASTGTTVTLGTP